MGRIPPLRFLLASTGSTAPPALLEAGYPSLDLDQGHFPLGSECVELPVRGGVLRGVYVPAGSGAPLVLHLLESSGSVTYGTEHLLGYPLLHELRELGCASLMIDFRGIGASEGSRMPTKMVGDTRVMWAEALRRAGGGARILLRGMSLGTLALASLLEAGARPAGVIMVAPVRAETVARNWFHHYHHHWLARASTLLLRKPVRVRMVRVLEEWRGPLLVTAPHQDYVLPVAEQELLRVAALANGASWVGTPYSHAGHVVEAHHVWPEERIFLRRVFPELPSETSPRRLDPPCLAAAVATRNVEDPNLLAWLRSLPPARLRSLGEEGCRLLLDAALAPEAPSPSELLTLGRYLRDEDLPRPDQGFAGLAAELGWEDAAGVQRLALAAGFPSVPS